MNDYPKYFTRYEYGKCVPFSDCDYVKITRPGGRIFLCKGGEIRKGESRERGFLGRWGEFIKQIPRYEIPLLL